jgi:hypothetical protein
MTKCLEPASSSIVLSAIDEVDANFFALSTSCEKPPRYPSNEDVTKC